MVPAVSDRVFARGLLRVKLCFGTDTRWRGVMAKISGNSSIVLAACVAAVLALSSAAGQQRGAPDRAPDAKDELAQNFLAEHEIGRRFHIDPADLPAPKSGAIVTNRSLVVPNDGQGCRFHPASSRRRLPQVLPT